MNKLEFLTQAKSKYNDKFDYSNLNFVNAQTKGTMTCSVHNFEFQQTPYRHLNGNGGCLKCQYESNSLKRSNSLEMFLLKAKEIHGDKYDYSKFNYISNKTKGILRCNMCKKEWEVRPDSHLFAKSGCPICNKAQIYTKQYYLAKGIENHKAYLYIALFSSDNEQFVKIGITKHENVRCRFRGHAYYNIRIVTSYETDFFNAYEIEQMLLEKYCKYSYVPLEVFSGHTECFAMEIYDQVVADTTSVLNNRNIVLNPSN